MDDIAQTITVAPSIPFATVDVERQDSTTSSICLDICCQKCGNAMTPVKLHLAAYFSKELQYKPTLSQRKNNKKTACSHYGEVLTSDEVVERIESKEREKKEQEEERIKKKAEQERRKCFREEVKQMRKEEQEKKKEEREKKRKEQAEKKEEQARIRAEKKKQKETGRQKANGENFA